MQEREFDVIIVGYGPVAELLAVMLGQQGRKVAIFERWTERYNLPRAVCVDHEIFRMLSALGMGDVLPSVSHPSPPYYQWFNADWKEILRIDFSGESVSGGPETYFVHQPTLEGMLDEQVRRFPNVELNLGWEVQQVSQDQASATIVAKNKSTSLERTASARFVIGCDGANSLVRKAIGGDQEDRGFDADWLVIDILPNEGVTLDLPPAGQWCNPARPTTIVPAGVKDGRFFRRWEFMRLPNEKSDDLESEEVAWRLLAPWVRRDQATMVRHKVYTFRSLLASKWRNGRLLIAGDAAHVMPPFMGQGMCSGFRDDWNLAWKLNLILDGKADAALLDSYQQERSPHVSDVIDLSMFLGKVICQPDPAQAAERDAAFLSGAVPPPPPFPNLTTGLIYPEGAEGKALAGKLSPHGNVKQGRSEGRFDDVVGAGRFILLANAVSVIDQLPQATLIALDVLDVAVVALEGPAADKRVIDDRHGRFTNLLRKNGLIAALIRPDFYVYGGAADEQALVEMIGGLERSLHLKNAGAKSAA